MNRLIYIVLLLLLISCNTKTEEKIESYLACDLCLAYEGVYTYARKVKDSAAIKKYKIVERQIDSLEHLFGGDIDSARMECKKILKVKELYDIDGNKEYFVKLFQLCGGGFVTDCWNHSFEYTKIEDDLRYDKKYGDYFEAAFFGERYYVTKFEYLYLMQYGQKQYILQKQADLRVKKTAISRIKKIDKGMVTDLDVMIFSNFVYSKEVLPELSDLLKEKKYLILSERIKDHVSIHDVITEEENERRKLEVKKIKALQEK